MTTASTPTHAPAPTTADLAISGGAAVRETPVPFMRPQLQPQDVEAAHAVLQSGMLRQATKCAELEERFSGQTDAKHGLTCANGTCALQLAYGSLIKPGDDVLVPAWTYIATASMIVAAGARPVFFDCHEDTFQADLADAAAKRTPKTTAIALTHLYGCPVDIDAAQAFAAEHGLKVIYDSAQAHLARYKGKGVGAFGDAVTYSFYATKNLGTGEGGILTVNDDTLRDTIAALRSHGETDKYLHTSIGFNYRMNDITAAIGCSRLDRLEDESNERRKAAAQYTALLKDIEGLHAPTVTEGAEPVWHLYTVKMDLPRFSVDRDTFCEALKAEGVPTAIHYPRSLTRQPAFADVEGLTHPPVSDGLSARVLSLPMHHALTAEDIEAVGAALRKVAAAYRV
ncbi:MAG: DegT/DnrJ/EryC1/StrS family aminotransferase [Planctomycetota bacterium]